MPEEPQQFRINTEQLVAQLEKIRADHGEETFQKARHDLALSLVLQNNGATFVRNAFPDMDIEALRAEAEAQQAEAAEAAQQAATPEQMMLNMLRTQMPNLKTQGHYNHFMACFDALRVTCNAYFGRNEEAAKKGRATLELALDAVAKIPGVEDQLAEMPDEGKGEQAKAFEVPAKELHEYDLHKRLAAELATVDSGDALQKWYDDNREDLDGIVSQKLRNSLFDEIRRKRNQFQEAEAN